MLVPSAHSSTANLISVVVGAICGYFRPPCALVSGGCDSGSPGWEKLWKFLLCIRGNLDLVSVEILA